MNISLVLGPLITAALVLFYFRGSVILRLDNSREWKYSMLITVELFFYHIAVLRTRKYGVFISILQQQHLYLSDNLHCIYYLIAVFAIVPISYLKYRLS